MKKTYCSIFEQAREIMEKHGIKPPPKIDSCYIVPEVIMYSETSGRNIFFTDNDTTKEAINKILDSLNIKMMSETSGRISRNTDTDLESAIKIIVNDEIIKSKIFDS